MLCVCACTGNDTVSPTNPNQSQQDATPAPTPAPTDAPTEPPKSEATVNAENLIAAIGEVTVGGDNDSGAAITAAEEAYNALSDEEKADVENADVLTAARAAYDQLVAEAANKEAAQNVVNEINNLSDSSNADEVVTVLHLYQELSKEVQAYVDNYDTLKELAHNLGEKRLNNMTEEEDFVRGYSFYYPEAFPYGDEYWYADQGCFALPYLGTSSSDVWLRLVFNFNRYDWIFFTDVTVAADDERFYESFSYWDVVRDNGGGEVWEYMDTDVGSYEIEMLWAIANSEKTVVRFEGDDYYYDYTVTSEQKSSIKYTLITYELLNA